MTILERLHRFCQRTLGPCTLEPQPGGRITQVVDAHGRRHIAKVHTSHAKYQREAHAYTHWTPALGHHAPRLLAVAPDLPAVLLTALPGTPADRHRHQTDTHRLWVQRQAGQLLRRLHNAQPATPMTAFAERLADRLNDWLAAADGLLTVAEQHRIRHHVAALSELPPPHGVPCHLDYQPHNWLVDHDGTLAIVDFEHARIDAAPRDLVRLTYRYWPTQPQLREAFFDGYGRPLTSAEQQLLIHCAALDVVTCLVRARDTANPALARHGRATLRQLPAPP